VLKPGGLLLRTMGAGKASRFSHDNQALDWVESAIPAHIFASREMKHDFLFSGDIAVIHELF